MRFARSARDSPNSSIAHRHPPIHSIRLCCARILNLAVMRAILFILGLLSAVAFAQTSLCRGQQNYKLTIKHRWDKATDKDYNERTNHIGFVVSVVHNQHYDIFEPNKNLTEDVRHLVEKNKFGPMKKKLEGFQQNSQKKVHFIDYVDRLPVGSNVKLNVKMDADAAGNTFVSVIGVLLGRPDSFFGLWRLNLCRNGNFTVRLPARGSSEVWVRGYDAGFNAAPESGADGTAFIPETRGRGVQVESRAGLQSREHYATYTFEQGSFDRYFPFWKILVIVGCLATALLVAFICLYPVCCKKQMLDVPVPLQDEAQYAT